MVILPGIIYIYYIKYEIVCGYINSYKTIPLIIPGGGPLITPGAGIWFGGIGTPRPIVTGGGTPVITKECLNTFIHYYITL